MVAEVGQRGQAFGLMSGLQVAGSQLVGDVVAQVTGERLGAVQRIDRFGALMIEDVRISHDKPRQRPGIFLGMCARVRFHSGITRRSRS